MEFESAEESTSTYSQDLQSLPRVSEEIQGALSLKRLIMWKMSLLREYFFFFFFFPFKTFSTKILTKIMPLCFFLQCIYKQYIKAVQPFVVYMPVKSITVMEQV